MSLAEHNLHSMPLFLPHYHFSINYLLSTTITNVFMRINSRFDDMKENRFSTYFYITKNTWAGGFLRKLLTIRTVNLLKLSYKFTIIPFLDSQRIYRRTNKISRQTVN